MADRVGQYRSFPERIPEDNDGSPGFDGDLHPRGRDGIFSGAAHQLRVGQPAVSKTVAQLESYLGVKLLTRSTRRLTPTEAGLGYFERAKRAIEEADEAELAARGAGTGLKGRLRVCATVTFARIHLVSAVAAIPRTTPGPQP
jgi:DNA-binding transcriptional LysR family regulator